MVSKLPYEPMSEPYSTTGGVAPRATAAAAIRAASGASLAASAALNLFQYVHIAAILTTVMPKRTRT